MDIPQRDAGFFSHARCGPVLLNRHREKLKRHAQDFVSHPLSAWRHAPSVMPGVGLESAAQMAIAGGKRGGRPCFAKILIANRGEIACRVIRHRKAARRGDRGGLFRCRPARRCMSRMADEAVHIGPLPAAESYLSGERIIAAAKATGAEAIHPGYGFLSENPDFVEAVEAAGLVFIGPSAKAIRAMGLKDAAKRLMEKAGRARGARLSRRSAGTRRSRGGKANEIGLSAC